MYIPKINNGRVELYNEMGGYQRSLSGVSDAVFADINAAQTLIVVTKKNGRVEIYNEMGGYQRSFGLSDAISARWAGSDVVVTRSGGQVELYNERGGYQRRL